MKTMIFTDAAARYAPSHPNPDTLTVTGFDASGDLMLSQDWGKAGPIWLTKEDARTLAEAILAELNAEAMPKTTYAQPKAVAVKPVPYSTLSPQAQTVLQHMRRAGSISAREAMADHGITSAALARRICDLEAGAYTIKRKRKTHPLTGKLYTRYSVVES